MHKHMTGFWRWLYHEFIVGIGQFFKEEWQLVLSVVAFFAIIFVPIFLSTLTGNLYCFLLWLLFIPYILILAYADYRDMVDPK